MPKPLRIFSGTWIINSKQVIVCIAATSEAEVVRALNAFQGHEIRGTKSQVKNYWHHDSRSKDTEFCLSYPGELFATSNTNYPRVYLPIRVQKDLITKEQKHWKYYLDSGDNIE